MSCELNKNEPWHTCHHNCYLIGPTGPRGPEGVIGPTGPTGPTYT